MLWLFWIAALPLQALPEAVHHTALTAHYDPEERLLEGTEALRWRNTTNTAINELQFHLYLNAFAHNRTTFMVERPSTFMNEGDWGWIQVQALRLADGTDLQPLAEFIQPDDDNPYDRTVARYPLPEPLLPGEWIDLDIEFTAKFPRVVARTGAKGDFILGAQWFPKIAVFEAAGQRGRSAAGWNAHQFHAHSEFYADFGDYRVSLTLPEKYAGRIGATGQLISEEVDEEGLVTAIFEQKGVHDFAWTADPNYQVIESRFDPTVDVSATDRAAAAALLGESPEDLPRLTPVEIRLLIQPNDRSQADRLLEAIKASIRIMGLELGPYPYATLTLVDPPADASGAAGMEYPTFITLQTHATLDLPLMRKVLVPELVAAHEFAHQYFQGMVASNEFEESWLDEGLTSYYESRIMDQAYGPERMSFLGWGIDGSLLNRLSLGDLPFRSDPMVGPTWKFRSGNSWGVNSYSRPAVMLEHLEQVHGEQEFAQAMRHYFRRYQWRHPSTTDFELSIQESLGVDLDSFFRQVFDSTGRLDYAVGPIRNQAVEEPEGEEWGLGERLLEGRAAEFFVPGARYRASVEVLRQGEMVHPIAVEITFDDGSIISRQWDGEKRWIRWTFVGDRQIVSAHIDPEGRMRLDMDRFNNSRRVAKDRAPARSVLRRVTFWLQNLFQATSLFA